MTLTRAPRLRAPALTRRTVLGGTLAMPALIGAARAQSPALMKIGTATLNDSQHEWMKRFAALVGERSAGRIKVEIYPASQLGPIPRMIEGTQLGSIQAYVGPPEFLTAIDERFEVLSTPSIFRDFAHANAIIQDPEFNKAFLALGRDRGLYGLGIMLSGPVCFNARQPLRRLADLQGKKIRVLSAPIVMEQIRRLDGVPVVMSLGDVLPALQQGTIDGVFSSVPVLAALRYFDTARYILETHHGVVTAVTVANRRWLEQLPSDLRAVIDTAGAEVSRGLYQWSVDFIEQQRGAWRSNGGEIVDISAADKADLARRFDGVAQAAWSTKPAVLKLSEAMLEAARRT
jgi:TRAP-type transport system periplasmic protein